MALFMILAMVAMIYLKDKFDLLVIYQLIVFLFMALLFIVYIILIIREKRQKRQKRRNNNNLNNKEAETEEVLHESIELSKSKKYCSIESTPEKVKDFDEKTKGFHYIDY